MSLRYEFVVDPIRGPPETLSIHCYDSDGYRVFCATVRDPLPLIRASRKGKMRGYDAKPDQNLHFEIVKMHGGDWRRLPRRGIKWTCHDLTSITPHNASFDRMLQAISQLPIPEDA